MKKYYIYIMTNRSGTLYIGVTRDLAGRVFQHKEGKGSTFTSKYRIDKLIYYEEFDYVYEAISREKQLKGWLRSKKVGLIESVNPEWVDLSAGWYEE
jgi:putative endonuclease